MGATACSSESGCRRPSGTARLNIKPAFRTPGNHAAYSVISLSSFFFAAFAQPCRFGIAVAFHETGKSLVAGGYEIYNLALCLVLFSTFSCQRLTGGERLRIR